MRKTHQRSRSPEVPHGRELGPERCRPREQVVTQGASGHAPQELTLLFQLKMIDLTPPAEHEFIPYVLLVR